jgi:glutamate synthase domain-containing protein 3
MTGGVAVVLGKTGRNFAAGMSGGVAFVWNADGQFEKWVNRGGGSILLEEVIDPEDIDLLRDLIDNHLRYTDSERAAYVLNNWDTVLPQFVKVISVEYKTMLAELAREAEGEAVGV